jgi:epoxyqueuosine reductase
MTLTGHVKAEARRLGFIGVAIVPVAPPVTHRFYRDWLAAGFAGTMGYLHRHAPLKQDPAALLPGARSLISVTLNYQPAPQPPPAAGQHRGRVARYAWGRDYHDVLREKLEQLARFLAAKLKETAGQGLAWRACVDSAPLMEREFAARGGLGWVGKNGNLIHWEQGSWLVLGELLVDVALDPDTPPAPRDAAGPPREAAGLPGTAHPDALLPLRESCGTCTACIAACPTQAIVADKTVDARRCISYLTIELKGPVPLELRPAVGDWVFGCDVCQEVCPWNRAAPVTTEPAFQGDADAAFPPLAELLALDEAGFRARFGRTALARPRRRGLLRNACIALGNGLATRGGNGQGQDQGAASAALQRALADSEPLIRGAAAWALGRSRQDAARGWLEHALSIETDPGVREELSSAIAGFSPTPTEAP